MEKAFWDEILDSLQGVKPDYSRLLSLLKEVRDELCDLAPQKWKADILNSIDLDILSQVNPYSTLLSVLLHSSTTLENVSHFFVQL